MPDVFRPPADVERSAGPCGSPDRSTHRSSRGTSVPTRAH